ncbi:MAG: TIGR00341 family protein, partial [Leptospiraceae bacterium]|nr:TIGR00341 family protein [Leptospiraceae bacterium]
MFVKKKTEDDVMNPEGLKREKEKAKKAAKSDDTEKTPAASNPGFWSFFRKNYKQQKETEPELGFVSRIKRVYENYTEVKETEQTNLNTYSSIEKAARLNKEFLTLLVGSCLIATFGLLAGSTAVIIGAMLIAPLMMPILGFSLSIIWGDRTLLWQSLRTLLLGSMLVLVVSSLISFLLPGVEFNPEMMARVNPTLFDILIAIASGLVGAYAYVNPNISSSISGVAIAVALMPPLCTVGISIGQGEVRFALGATLLYSINLIGISLAASIVFWRTRVHPVHEDEKEVKGRALQNVLLSSLLLFLIALPVSYFTYQSYQTNRQDRAVRDIIENTSETSEILQLNIIRRRDTVKVKAVFIVLNNFNS